MKRFDTTLALDAVDLIVEEGEVRGLLGPNGAGKTTLLRILFGLVRADAGAVELFDRPVNVSDSSALEGVAGFVEDPCFYPYLSGRVNLELIAEQDGGGTGARIDEVLARAGLASRSAERVSGYSSGMRQRLGLAAALLRAPRLLLLDEPTAGLDPAGVREMGALVRELSAAGVAILLSSHQMGEVQDVCDTFTVLHRGRVVWDGTAAELQAAAPASAYELSTSDDPRALEIAERRPGVRALESPAGGLEVTAEDGRLDPYVVALGRAGIAVRRLELPVSPLEAMFFALTGEQDIVRPDESTAAPQAAATAPTLTSDRGTGTGSPREAGVWRVFRTESRKLSAQLAIRLVALVCLVGPFVFAAILKVQSGSPTDTLYGVWVHSSGFALSIVLLAFAGSWGFPLLAGIVAGDLFSSEDRYGTWKLVLTGASTRWDLFLGKVLAAAAFSSALVGLTALSSLVAGVLLIGDQALISLSGTLLSPGRSLGLVIASWLVCVLPTLAFASLAVLLSIATRNGIVGVIGPGLAALAMQLLLLVGAGIWAHLLLVASAFGSWHALFNAQPFYGRLVIGILVSIIWILVCLRLSWLILRRRDFAGAPVTRRQGWVMPVRVAAALTGVIVLVAIAGNWGPTGVTAARLKASLIPTFNRLTVLQQRELGRQVAPGAKLTIVLPTCSRRGSTPTGPGDWVCTLNVLIPTSNSLPPQPTPVTYDVSVQSDGCYKAQSPPAFIGQQMMREADGQQVVNPLYTIYGCFSTM